jgi:hypothetical protein
VNDPTYTMAELEKSRERWRIAALTSLLLLALLVLGGVSVGLVWQAEARQARMQAEAERDRIMQAEHMARLMLAQRLATQMTQAPQLVEEGKEPPPVPSEKRD